MSPQTIEFSDGLSPRKKRDESIDLMKCIGCLFIIFAHSGNLLGAYKNFTFGGMFGNAIFFFSSGFFLFKKIEIRFDNWYKKRIVRIYPSLFALAIILTFLGLSESNIKEIILNGGGWFVSCIMVHYIAVYILCKYLLDKLEMIFLIISIVVTIWFLFGHFETDFNRVPTYFKWSFWFLFTLFGGIIGKKIERIKYRKFDIVLFLIFISIHYIIMFFANKYSEIRKIDIISLVPLLLGTYYFYKTCAAKNIGGGGLLNVIALKLK
jgi:surface polysaccharide O-acyltransferase-like enzyme